MTTPNSPESTPGSTAQALVARDVEGVGAYIRSGAPYVWVTAAAISVAFIITLALLFLTAARGLPHFWPADLLKARYEPVGDEARTVLAEIRSAEEVTSGRLKNAGLKVDESQPLYE
ncbi:MAG: phosphate ABC transporter permease PstA, partial [Panacagrimonas sp.]